MDDWKEVTLADIADIVPGFAFKGSDFGTVGQCVIKIKDIIPPIIDILHANKIDIKKYNKHKIDKYKIKKNDFVVAMTGATIGKVGVLTRETEAYVNQRVAIIKPHNNMSKEFVYYTTQVTEFYNHIKNNIDSNSAQENISGNSIGKYIIYIPSLDYQNCIVDILSPLDYKIELNRKMNETLEQMAQAVFQDWFVDFGPVKRKLEGINDPVTILGGLIPDPAQAREVANLFPDQFAEDGLPEGWTIREIGKIVSVIGGSTPSTSNTDYWCDKTDGYNWATPKDISKLDGLYLFDTDRHISQKGLDKISSGLLPVGTVLLSSRAPIGYLAITGVPTAVNQGFIGLIPSKKMPASMLYFWCKENMEEIKIRANGSTFMEISKTNFRPIPTILASDEIINLYDKISNNYLNLIQLNLLQNRTLAEMRDLLLSKLMSGEISVDELEKKMGGVL